MTAREQKALEAEAMSKWPPVDKSKFNDDWMFKNDKASGLWKPRGSREDD